MKIHELLTEAINLAKWFDTTEDVIRDIIMEIVESLQLLKKTPYAMQYKEKVEAGNISSLVTSSFLQTNLLDKLEQRLTRGLFSLGHAITDGSLSRVIFQQLRDDHGHAVGTTVVINSEILQVIQESLSQTLENITLDEAESETDLYNAFFRVVGDQHYQNYILNKIDSYINSLSRTFIHELVHVLQHYKQSHRDGNLEFRSYLDKGKIKRKSGQAEYRTLALNRADHTPEQKRRWSKLYYASPQEIAAFSHNIAQDIIKDYELKKREKFELIDQDFMNTVYSAIPEYVLAYSMPTNPKEKRISRRYQKIVKNVLNSYIDLLVSRL